MKPDFHTAFSHHQVALQVLRRFTCDAEVIKNCENGCYHSNATFQSAFSQIQYDWVCANVCSSSKRPLLPVFIS